MAYIFTVDEFVKKLNLALAQKTLYVMGCFGAPLNAANKQRYTQNHFYNKKPERTAMINNATDSTFGFDCVCLIKGILWGWNADAYAVYGGAKYASNGVPDVGTDEILKYCTEVSSDFSKIVKGELVQMNGHVGVYIGDGKVVECSPAWANGVQVTRLEQRKWLKHGKMMWLDYSDEKAAPSAEVIPLVGDLITTSTDLKGYTTASKAIAQGKSSVIYKAGNYYIYKIYVDSKGRKSHNISKNKGVPGAWVVL